MTVIDSAFLAAANPPPPGGGDATVDLSGARHPGKLYHCQRAARDIPLSPPRCAHPKGYCRWRTACPVHALEKEQARGG
ncbi:MAG: hypothetical protein SCH98_02305 [Deferrisomatales bacterium]|nr:hypothetical protein [Deferrisomatales bacterium]